MLFNTYTKDLLTLANWGLLVATNFGSTRLTIGEAPLCTRKNGSTAIRAERRIFIEFV